jgi:type II restriction enzyme
MFANRKIKNVLDYVTGVEVGLDTNARKNRGGKMMSKLFEHFLNESKIKFYKETKLKNIPNLNIPDNIKNKQFDFVFLINDIVYGVEVNFYSGGGSKLNETAKSYVELNNEFKKIPNFKFL